MLQTIALYNNVNPKNKSTAVLEIIIMLVIAALLGYLLRYYQEHNRETASDSSGDSVVADNLQKIEGVGSKIEGLLNEAGIKTFDKLSNTSTATLKEILESAGARYQVHDPSSWAKQAKLAVNGDWDMLDEMQAKLKGGKS